MNRSAAFIITNGDIFKSNCQALVCPVNTFGVMGKGLALKFKKKYPAMFRKYEQICRHRMLYVGQVLVWENITSKLPLYVICFPTKTDWRRPSDYSFIIHSMKDLKNEIIQRRINSIAIPALGCGLGGLDFDKVLDIIQNELFDLRNIRIYLFPPKEAGSWKKLNA